MRSLWTCEDDIMIRNTYYLGSKGIHVRLVRSWGKMCSSILSRDISHWKRAMKHRTPALEGLSICGAREGGIRRGPDAGGECGQGGRRLVRAECIE